MRVVGLDLSLKSTGVARLVPGLTDRMPPLTARLQPPRALHEAGRAHDRLDWLLPELWAHVRGSDLAVVEGPAFDKNNGQHAIGGLWWLVTHTLLHRNQIPYVVVTPTQLKTYALGKGSGKGTDKDQVLAAVIRRYLMVGVAGNDEADALVLAAMAADHYGHPVVPVPQTHSRVLANVTWPDRERLAA